MNVLEYECQACGRDFLVLVGDAAKCPHCRANQYPQPMTEEDFEPADGSSEEGLRKFRVFWLMRGRTTVVAGDVEEAEEAFLFAAECSERILENTDTGHEIVFIEEV